MDSNLDLWRLVEKTPVAQTKPITGKNYRGTSPKPYWLIQKATETFGPCGIGWGFEVVNERVEDGAPGDKVHIAHVRVWYKWNGEVGHVEHVGQTMFCGTNKKGPFTDEDAPKKSVTDAVVKALSMIGFAGDIFMGRYDDSKYVDGLIAEEDAANDETPALIADARTRFHNCTTRGELRTLFAGLPSAVRKALKDEATALADKLPETEQEAA
jgi:hypothetical protein